MTLRERARNKYPAPSDNDLFGAALQGIKQNSFLEGAECMYQQAVTWLDQNARNYFWTETFENENGTPVRHIDGFELLQDFKKAMLNE